MPPSFSGHELFFGNEKEVPKKGEEEGVKVS